MAYKYRPKGNYNKNKDNFLPILLIIIGIFSGFGILIPIGVFWLIYLAKNADENNNVYTRSYRPRTRPNNSAKPIIDIEEDDDVVIYGDPQDLFKIKECITKVLPNVVFDMDEITMLAKEKVELIGEDLDLFRKLLVMLDDVEDVSNVYHNVSNV